MGFEPEMVSTPQVMCPARKKKKGEGKGIQIMPGMKQQNCREGRTTLGEGHCREKAGMIPFGEEKPGGIKN